MLFLLCLFCHTAYFFNQTIESGVSKSQGTSQVLKSRMVFYTDSTVLDFVITSQPSSVHNPSKKIQKVKRNIEQMQG